MKEAVALCPSLTRGGTAPRRQGVSEGASCGSTYVGSCSHQLEAHLQALPWSSQGSKAALFLFSLVPNFRWVKNQGMMLFMLVTKGFFFFNSVLISQLLLKSLLSAFSFLNWHNDTGITQTRQLRGLLIKLRRKDSYAVMP